MKVHFIAIGGSAMHNLAIALNRKGIEVSGSDDEIFEPSKSRLDKEGILPSAIGWDTSLITPNLDAVILGMHARNDNPELLKSKELGIPIYSYPEYLYEQSKFKKMKCRELYHPDLGDSRDFQHPATGVTFPGFCTDFEEFAI